MDIETAFRIRDEICYYNNVRKPNIKNPTPLAIAIQRADLDVVLFLLKSGANVNKSGNPNRSNLSLSLYQPNLKIVEILLDRGAEKNSNEIPIIMTAAAEHNVGAIELLIKHGLDVNEIAYGCTAITTSRAREHFSFNNIPNYPFRIIEEATKICIEETIKLLINAGAVDYSEGDFDRMWKDRVRDKIKKNIIDYLGKGGTFNNVQNTIECQVRKRVDHLKSKLTMSQKETDRESKVWREVITEAFADAGLL